MATVFVEDLKVDTVIGVCDWEKNVEQTLHFDIVMQVDIAAAADTDDLSKTVNYAAIAEDVAAYTKAQNCLLIETLLQGLLKHLMANYLQLSELSITLRKPMAIEDAAYAGITETLSRD
jgi:dihydroneopterin aldolase